MFEVLFPKASPTLTVLTIGAGALGNVPEPGSMLVGIGLSLMGLTAMELQSRRRSVFSLFAEHEIPLELKIMNGSANNYLDKANEELFKPRGLYCLVMSFRPDDVPQGEVALQDVDTSKDVLRWLSPPSSAMRANASRFRSSSGTTRGEPGLPESAPLIYPETGYVEVGKNGKDKDEAEGTTSFSTRKVVQEYFDKRAQAKYVSVFLHVHRRSMLERELTYILL